MLLMLTIAPSLLRAMNRLGKGLRAGKCTIHTDAEDALPGRQVEFQRRGDDDGGGAVDEDVHPPMLLHRAGDQCPALGGICHIRLGRADGRWRGYSNGRCCLARDLAVEIGHHDRGASACQRRGTGRADALRRAGDDGDFARQGISHCRSPGLHPRAPPAHPASWRRVPGIDRPGMSSTAPTTPSAR